MQQQNLNYYCPQDELDEELKIDLKDFGIEEKEDTNPIRKEILKMIYSASDSELEFCYKIMKTIMENSNLLH